MRSVPATSHSTSPSLTNNIGISHFSGRAFLLEENGSWVPTDRFFASNTTNDTYSHFDRSSANSPATTARPVSFDQPHSKEHFLSRTLFSESLSSWCQQVMSTDRPIRVLWKQRLFSYSSSVEPSRWVSEPYASVCARFGIISWDFWQNDNIVHQGTWNQRNSTVQQRDRIGLRGKTRSFTKTIEDERSRRGSKEKTEHARLLTLLDYENTHFGMSVCCWWHNSAVAHPIEAIKVSFD